MRKFFHGTDGRFLQPQSCMPSALVSNARSDSPSQTEEPSPAPPINISSPLRGRGSGQIDLWWGRPLPGGLCRLCKDKLPHPKKSLTGICIACWRTEWQSTVEKPQCHECQKILPGHQKSRTGLCRECWVAQEKLAAWQPPHCPGCGKPLSAPGVTYCQTCWHQRRTMELKGQIHLRPLVGRSFTSKAERHMMEVLDSLLIPYQHHVAWGRMVLDFVLEQQKAVIEVNGTYYHKLPGGKERDEGKRIKIEAAGYQVLFLWTDQEHLWWKQLQSVLSLPVLPSPSTTSL